MATSLTLQYQDGGKVFKDDVRAIKDALEKLNTTKKTPRRILLGILSKNS